MSFTCNDSHRKRNQCRKCWNHESCEVLHRGSAETLRLHAKEDFAKGRKEKKENQS